MIELRCWDLLHQQWITLDLFLKGTIEILDLFSILQDFQITSKSEIIFSEIASADKNVNVICFVWQYSRLRAFWNIGSASLCQFPEFLFRCKDFIKSLQNAAGGKSAENQLTVAKKLGYFLLQRNDQMVALWKAICIQITFFVINYNTNTSKVEVSKNVTKSYTYNDRLTPLSVYMMFFKGKRKKHGRWEIGGKCHQGFPAAAANPPSEPGHKCRAPDKYKKHDIHKKNENEIKDN